MKNPISTPARLPTRLVPAIFNVEARVSLVNEELHLWLLRLSIVIITEQSLLLLLLALQSPLTRRLVLRTLGVHLLLDLALTLLLCLGLVDL